MAVFRVQSGDMDERIETDLVPNQTNAAAFFRLALARHGGIDKDGLRLGETVAITPEAVDGETLSASTLAIFQALGYTEDKQGDDIDGRKETA
jgi:hypothetical protein